MLRITTHKSETSVKLQLEGKLCGPWVREAEQCWRSMADLPESRGKPFVVDLTAVTFIDAAGKELLAQMRQKGAEFVAAGLMTKSIVEEISRSNQQLTNGGGWSEGMRKTLTSALLLVILPLLLGSLAAGAEEKPPMPLTLREAVQLALKQNPQVQIANLNVAESEQDHAEARAALLPQASLQVSEAVRRTNIEAFIGRPIPFFPQHSGPFTVFQAGPQFSIPIFDLTLWRRWQASRQGIRGTESQELSVREQVVLLVVSQYLGGLRAAAAVRASRSRVELAQVLYDQALDLQTHGVGTGLDTLRANVQLQAEKQRLIVAETQLKVALYGLARLLNLDPQHAIELTDEVSFFETPEFPISQSLEQAYATRPEMKALAAREMATLALRKAASESRLPRLSVTGGWAYQGLSLNRSIPSYQYQANVDMPLFTGGRIRAEITKAELELQKIFQQERELRNQVALEVKTAVAQLESARHEVEVANLGVKLAQEEVSQSRDRFLAGVANNIEVISAQDALARANDNQIGALYRYNQARADLARAIGQMETLYAK